MNSTSLAQLGLSHLERIAIPAKLDPMTASRDVLLAFCVRHPHGAPGYASKLSLAQLAGHVDRLQRQHPHVRVATPPAPPARKPASPAQRPAPRPPAPPTAEEQRIVDEALARSQARAERCAEMDLVMGLVPTRAWVERGPGGAIFHVGGAPRAAGTERGEKVVNLIDEMITDIDEELEELGKVVESVEDIDAVKRMRADLKGIRERRNKRPRQAAQSSGGAAAHVAGMDAAMGLAPQLGVRSEPGRVVFGVMTPAAAAAEIERRRR